MTTVLQVQFCLGSFSGPKCDGWGLGRTRTIGPYHVVRFPEAQSLDEEHAPVTRFEGSWWWATSQPHLCTLPLLLLKVCFLAFRVLASTVLVSMRCMTTVLVLEYY
jgi:hypothetical protein